MNDKEKIEWIVKLLKEEKTIECDHNDVEFNGIGSWSDNYGIRDFLAKLKNPTNGSKLDEILSNGSENVKNLFLEIIEKAKEYHCFDGEFKKRPESIGLNIDMLYRLMSDVKDNFVIRNDANIPNFIRKFKKRVEEYISFAIEGKYVES